MPGLATARHELPFTIDNSLAEKSLPNSNRSLLGSERPFNLHARESYAYKHFLKLSIPMILGVHDIRGNMPQKTCPRVVVPRLASQNATRLLVNLTNPRSNPNILINFSILMNCLASWRYQIRMKWSPNARYTLEQHHLAFPILLFLRVNCHISSWQSIILAQIMGTHLLHRCPTSE